MNTDGTPRRTLLQRGLALLAGGVAVATGTRVVLADNRIAPTPERRSDPSPPGTTFSFYTRQRPLAAPPAAARSAGAEDTRQLTSGDLLDAPDGRRIGAVYTNCFCPAAPFGVQKSRSDLEFQVMHLDNGMLFGMCGGAAEGGGKVHAIVGGTGRFLGARGAYVERPAAGARDVVEFFVTLAG